MATGISLSGTSNLATGQKILVAQAMLANEPAAPDPDLVSSSRIPSGHKQWDELIFGRLSAAAELTEGVDLTQTQQLAATSVSISPTEHGIIVTLSKRLIRRQGDSSVIATAGAQMGGSLRRQMANNVIALYDGFSTTSPGASVAIDVTHFRGAVAYVMTDNDSSYGPADMPLNAALHIEQISDIILDISDTTPRGTTTGFTDDLIRRWWKGSDRLYSVGIWHSGNIERDSSGDSKGAIFNAGALKLVMANDAETTEQADNSLRAIEYGLFQEWGEAERIDTWGVEIYSDSSSTL